MQMTVSCKKLDPRAKLPVYATPAASAAKIWAARAGDSVVKAATATSTGSSASRSPMYRG
ncbi:hypothetical protein H6B10_16840, partial [Gemmiger formicilis]|nr:hypothetical protein [Gemmiger formicilis]